MYLSYFQHPVLQLLDDDRCYDYINSPKCDLMMLMEREGDRVVATAEDGTPTTSTAFAKALTESLADGLLADRIKKVYMPSPSFDQALEKSHHVFEKMIQTSGVLMDVHEDCCFITGKGRTVKRFIYADGEDDDGWRNYHLFETIDGVLSYMAEYSLNANDERMRYNFTWHPEDDAPVFANMSDGQRLWWRLEQLYGYLVFKRYSDVEMEEVVREKTLKKSAIMREKVNNFMGINVTLLDSRWFTTICRNEGFAVSGHFRLQPYKTGPKLIYIAPFTKNGYHRKAKLETEKE
jgi:hypothetical protein